jgi:hypothetical protein
MKSFSLWHYKRLFKASSLLLLLAFFLVACGGIGGGSNPGATATGNTTPTTSTTPAVRLGAQPCPDAIKDPAHWTAIITPTTSSKVESASCGNLKGIPSLQALVTVRYDGTGAILDVYVYDHITDPSPVQLFKLQNLTRGSVKISGYNTVLTAEVDPNSSINAGQPDANLTQDLFREFKWSDAAGTLVPVAFPGFFPDLTRYQAEADPGEPGTPALETQCDTYRSGTGSQPAPAQMESRRPCDHCQRRWDARYQCCGQREEYQSRRRRHYSHHEPS